MEEKLAIDALAALAHPTRLGLFRLLVATGQDGLAAGMLAERLGVPSSTLSHHLTALEHAGLITQNRHQRSLIYSVSPQRISDLIAFLVDDCCGGQPEICGLYSAVTKDVCA